VLRRSFDGTNTTLIVSAFGEEEHQYSYSGSGSSDINTSNTYSYDLGGQVLGTWNGTASTTTFLLTDLLGSVVSRFNNLSSGAAVLGDQVYGPYGNQRTQQGTIGTSKGFTGQYNDWLTGLDYYGARYYDPVIGQFLSADVEEGNGVGMDPYSYVGDNPETWTDPTGQFFSPFDVGGIMVFSPAPKIPNILITTPIPYPNRLVTTPIPYPSRLVTPGSKGERGIAASTQSDGEGEPQPSIKYNHITRQYARKILRETVERRKKEGKPTEHTVVSVGFIQGRTLIGVNEHWASENDSPDNLAADDIAASVKAIVKELHPGVEYVGPESLVPRGSYIKHAEDFILDGIPRGTLQGIGSSISTGVCRRCQQAIGQLEPQVLPGILDNP
jgi:RHS repeat-associated protein